MPGRISSKELYESGEDYLEAILMLREENGRVYAIDIAKHLDVSKASVSKALSRLEERGYLAVNGRDIALSEAGAAVAERILRRHRFFTEFLISAGVDPEVAEEEACHIEHAVSEDSFEKIAATYGRS